MKPRFRRVSLTGPVAVLALLAAALACNVPGAGRPQDARATVVAVYGTITAQADITPGGAAITPSAPITPGPTLSLSPSASPSPTPPASRAADGSVVTIPRCTGAVTVDGTLGEWDALSAARFALDRAVYGNTRWTGPDDASGDARACWTDTALVLGISVTDDAHVQTEQGAAAWQGDEIELLFDGDLRGDYYETRWNSDDVQIGLSPGDFAGLPPSAVRFHPVLDEDLVLMLMAQRPLATGGNYTLEAEIPWSLLLGSVPQPETNYGLCLSVSDNDQPGAASQDSLISHCAGLRVVDPTTWLTIRFLR